MQYTFVIWLCSLQVLHFLKLQMKTKNKSKQIPISFSTPSNTDDLVFNSFQDNSSIN